MDYFSYICFNQLKHIPMARTKYYIIWVEGFEYLNGEKVKSLTNTGFSYTTKMTESLRIREDDITQMKAYMKRHGIADWVIESHNTFIKTNYAPKGTVLNPKRFAF
jgi:hypothetical protein